jgi:hypothetical protein
VASGDLYFKLFAMLSKEWADYNMGHQWWTGLAE